VRITVGDKGPVYEVAGIGHRRPVTRRIGASTAAALVAGGVPLIRHALPSTGARAKADQGPADAVLED
jgi:hypothetical protein